MAGLRGCDRSRLGGDRTVLVAGVGGVGGGRVRVDAG